MCFGYLAVFYVSTLLQLSLKKLFIIGQTFPEPSTTAAGERMMQLIYLFKQKDYSIHFATTATFSKRSEDLKQLDINIECIKLNDDGFDDYIKTLQPNAVLYDRYISEEQFGWRVSEIFPNAIRILDTEDLHFLRKAREQAVKNKVDVLKTNLFTETAKRELASMLRCDLSLIISEFEMNLLKKTFNISEDILFYLPFLLEKPSEEKINNYPVFENRKDFVTIGNLLHAPNVDAIIYLKNEIWPLIRKKLPQVKLHIYGAYAPPKIQQLHNEKEGFLIKGWAENANEVLKTSKVCLAPLRFGAGLKGKVVKAFYNGTPTVLTPIAAEGFSNVSIPETNSNSFENDFASEAISLYNDQELWDKRQNEGFEILQHQFSANLYNENLFNKLNAINADLTGSRNKNFYGEILRYQTNMATKYMSKWITEKNYNKT